MKAKRFINILYGTNKVVYFLTLGLFVTIYLGFLFEMLLGTVQALSSLLLLFTWKEMSKEHTKDSSNKLTKYTNQFIKKMTDNLETFSYNILIANLHEMNNYINKEISNNYTKETIVENYSKILITMMPIIPHFASECILMNKFNVNQTWPSYDESMLIEENVNIVVQINGKKRGIFEMKRDSSEKKVLLKIKEDKNLSKYLNNQDPKKIIYVKNKILNLIL